MNKYFQTGLSLFLSYFIIAILMNCLGVVILQMITQYHISHSTAGSFDAYKDLATLAFAFVCSSFLPRFGYKKSMLAGLSLLGMGCVLMAVWPGVVMIRIVLIMTGVSFMLIKIPVYGIVGLITKNARSHASLVSFLEGGFMLGVFSGFWIFGFFINSQQFVWSDTYYVLGIVAVVALILLFITPIREEGVNSGPSTSLAKDFMEMIRINAFPLTIIFVISTFTYVFIEQGVNTWLPTFQKEVLNLSAQKSVELASIMAISAAIGRFISSFLLRKIEWYWIAGLLLLCAIGILATVITSSIPVATTTINSWFDAPWQAFALPMVGLVLSPLYPVLSSVILSALPKSRHSSMMGLVMIYSALGGSIGSKVVGIVFGSNGGLHAIGLVIIPMSLLLLLIPLFNKVSKGKSGTILLSDSKVQA